MEIRDRLKYAYDKGIPVILVTAVARIGGTIVDPAGLNDDVPSVVLSCAPNSLAQVALAHVIAVCWDTP